MTTLREAAQLALEALEHLMNYSSPHGLATVTSTLRKALEADNSASRPEPVAWMVYTQDGTSAFVTDNPKDFTDTHRALPLYTAPPQRKPLKDEEILDLCMVCAIQPDSDPITLAFARAIERAHGIGEKR